MPLFRSLSDPATGLSDWAPEYPDPVRASPRWPRSDLAFIPLQGELSWLPSFPDRIGVRPRLNAGAFVFPLGWDGLGWLPRYPDLLKAPPAPNAGAFAYVPAVSRWGLDALPWLPTFPDFARARPAPQLWLGLVAYAAEPSVFPPPPVLSPLSWLARYPDQVLRPVRRPHLEPQVGVPSWRATVLPVMPVVWWPVDPPESVEGPTGDGQWWPKPADAPGLITAGRKKK